MATARSIRSNAAPASNRPHTKHQSSSRPELRVVSNPRGNEQGNVVGRVIECYVQLPYAVIPSLYEFVPCFWLCPETRSLVS